MPVKSVPAGCIVTDPEVNRLLALAARPSNHALLRLLYLDDLCISKVCDLRCAGAILIVERGAGVSLAVLCRAGPETQFRITSRGAAYRLEGK